MTIEQVALTFLTAIGVLIAYKELKELAHKNRADKADKEQEEEVAQAKKIAEIEGRVSGLEKAVGEIKIASTQFESRLISAVDKLENKIDKLLMDFYTRKQN